MRNSIKVFVGYAIFFTLLLGSVEFALEQSLANPDKLPESWVSSFRSYYFEKDRKIAQYLPELAKYDVELFYRLNPGDHEFSNAEFSTKFKVNSFGLRDDEESLQAPEVICIGDSYTMGWGVESEEGFPALIESQTGMKVLNAGISSYGTVREMKLLKSLDQSNLKYVILQFDANDNSENVNFFHTGIYKAPLEKIYDKTVDNHLSATAYFPLKHLSHFVRDFTSDYFPTPEPPIEEDSDNEEELPWVAPVDAFMKVLESDTLSKDVQLIIFQVGGASTDILIDRLFERKASETLGSYNNAIVLDMQQHLSNSDYYLLDGHLTKGGHAKVAAELIQHIK